jgi:hypothetical protein
LKTNKSEINIKTWCAIKRIQGFSRNAASNKRMDTVLSKDGGVAGI